MAAIDRNRRRDQDEKETDRVEAFSDGVFAVAITILVFEIMLPHDLPAGQRLSSALLARWPAFLAFVSSFATIGIMWINHHMLFTHIRRVDHTLLVLNGLLLLSVTFVPFPTAVIAEYTRSPDQRTAMLLYTGTFVANAILFNLLWRYASTGHRLLGHDADGEAVDAITRGYAWGPPLYATSFVLAAINPLSALALTIALAVFFAMPRGRPSGRPARGGGGS